MRDKKIHIKAIVVILASFLFCSCSSQLTYDPRIHNPASIYGYNIDTVNLLKTTPKSDPLHYFYAVHANDYDAYMTDYTPKQRNDLVDSLCQCLTNEHCGARWRITKELGSFGDNRAVPYLIHVLETPALDYLHDNAAESLGRLKDPRAVRPIIKAISEGKMATVGIYALVSIKTKESISFVCNLLKKSVHDYLRTESAISLTWVRESDDAYKALEYAFQHDSNISVRVFCAFGLIKNKDHKYYNYLIGQLDNEDMHVRRAAAECLTFRYRPKKEDIPLLIKIYRNKDSETAMQAGYILEQGFPEIQVRCYPPEKYKERLYIADQYLIEWNRVKNDTHWMLQYGYE